MSQGEKWEWAGSKQLASTLFELLGPCLNSVLGVKLLVQQEGYLRDVFKAQRRSSGLWRDTHQAHHSHTAPFTSEGLSPFPMANEGKMLLLAGAQSSRSLDSYW